MDNYLAHLTGQPATSSPLAPTTPDVAGEVKEAIRATGHSVPHPSTTTGGLSGTLDPVWAERIARQLPQRTPGSTQTTGVVLEPDGTQTTITSGKDEETARADLVLVNSEHFPKHPMDAPPAVSKHVEVKVAMRMREKGIPYGAVVINKAMCSGDYNCYNAVRAILPVGYKLVVWEPGATHQAHHHRGDSSPVMTDSPILTAIVDNEHRYARTDTEKDDIVQVVVGVVHLDWPSLLYVWDQPCRSFRENDGPTYPGHQLRVSTDPDAGWGALNYWVTTEGGLLEPWDSFNPNPPQDAPELWFDIDAEVRFRRNAALPMNEIRHAVEEFVQAGQRPTSIQWQPAENW